MPGIFTISLDFELHWGVFDKKDRQQRKACYLNTLESIPKVLALFEKYGVHATWAVVGSVMAKDRQEWERWKPVIEPCYAVEDYSAYAWVRKNDLGPAYRWAHFAPETVSAILLCRGQELGTHTFGHFYCLEQQAANEAFDADLKAATAAAEKFGCRLSSLVFPRNQFNPEHLRTCFANGIRVVRSNPSSWFWSPITDKSANPVRKIFRTGDAYVPLATRRTSYPLAAIQARPGEPLQLPASRLFRPWSPKMPVLGKLSLRRSIRELYAAASQGECYHLWWHPENFGDYPQQNLLRLELLLTHFQKCREKYSMESWNMGEYASLLNEEGEMCKDILQYSS
ncbi:polysaccharide deacetylase family protein [Flavisolibacter nicotianae]|uniref:polysaccharide deacetylase family protein n=1 Tax=Flavisolibacter nicotianae TaxID=2364882 RepID=UPI000EB49DDE|nr:polysaccharide deacetylase family protein [Flavisolibacter nicotianae]